MLRFLPDLPSAIILRPLGQRVTRLRFLPDLPSAIIRFLHRVSRFPLRFLPDLPSAIMRPRELVTYSALRFLPDLPSAIIDVYLPSLVTGLVRWAFADEKMMRTRQKRVNCSGFLLAGSRPFPWKLTIFSYCLSVK